MRRALVKYLLKWNSFSSSVNCLFVKFVRAELLLLFNNSVLLIAAVGSPIWIEKTKWTTNSVDEWKCWLASTNLHTEQWTCHDTTSSVHLMIIYCVLLQWCWQFCGWKWIEVLRISHFGWVDLIQMIRVNFQMILDRSIFLLFFIDKILEWVLLTILR